MPEPASGSLNAPVDPPVSPPPLPSLALPAAPAPPVAVPLLELTAPVPDENPLPLVVLPHAAADATIVNPYNPIEDDQRMRSRIRVGDPRRKETFCSRSHVMAKSH